MGTPVDSLLSAHIWALYERRDGEGRQVCNKCGLHWYHHKQNRPVEEGEESRNQEIKRRKPRYQTMNKSTQTPQNQETKPWRMVVTITITKWRITIIVGVIVAAVVVSNGILMASFARFERMENQPPNKKPKPGLGSDYNWDLHDFGTIFLKYTLEASTSKPLSSVFSPGINDDGERRFFCDRTCGSTKKGYPAPG